MTDIHVFGWRCSTCLQAPSQLYVDTGQCDRDAMGHATSTGHTVELFNAPEVMRRLPAEGPFSFAAIVAQEARKREDMRYGIETLDAMLADPDLDPDVRVLTERARERAVKYLDGGWTNPSD